jgi:hypothetical protein
MEAGLDGLLIGHPDLVRTFLILCAQQRWTATLGKTVGKV